MQVKDLIVTGDARILGNLYTKDGNIGAGGGGGGGESGSGVTYRLTKSGSTITLTGSDGSSSSVTDSNTTTSVDLSGYVPTSRTVNGKALSSNITLSASDVGAAPSSHTHSYAASSHTHDDRYYTETEINNKLSGYSPTSHTHDGRYYTETEINNKLSGYSPTSHTHSNYAASNHTHNYLPATQVGSSAHSWIYTATSGDQRYLNPPMVAGVDYVTFEKHLNVPVHTCLLSLGQLLSSGMKEISLPSGTTKVNMLECQGYAVAADGSTFAPFPWISDNKEILAKAGVSFTKGKAYIKTFFNATAYNGFILIKYCY